MLRPNNTKQVARVRLAQDINAYLKAGGTIEKVPRGEGKEKQDLEKEIYFNRKRMYVEKL